MNDDTLPAESPSAAVTIDEERRRRFEAAWSDAARIEDHLPEPTSTAYLGTLIELIAIDLELAFKAGQPRSVADYHARFPDIAPAIIEDLFAEVAHEAAKAGPRPGAVLGGFRLIEVQGRGGFGVVWRAEDTTLGREVALKTMARGDDEERRHFIAEARVTAGLEHPGIVPVHALGSGDMASPWYAMKFVRGRTLAAMIKDARTPVATRRLFEVVLGVSRALAFAHARGVVHRDVKPDNIIVGDYGETILLDWGLARSPGGDEVAPDGTIIGTPAYMAPEQAEGRLDAQDARTDVYALGAVLYEVLTGVRPHSGSSPASVIASAIAPSPPPRAVAKGVPRPLDALCTKAMAKRPSDRYADAGELARDLERWLADEPVSAHRERWHERLGRSFRRHRIAYSVGIAAMVLIVIGITIGLGAWRAATLERIADARTAAARDEALARSTLAHDPAATRAVLALTLSRLSEEPALSDLHARLSALSTRAERLSAFVAHTEEAWFLAGEERDQAAITAIDKALAATESLAAPPATSTGPCADFAADLPPTELARCRARSHRLMILKGLIQAKPALANPFADRAKVACSTGWRSLERARAIAPSAFLELVQALCSRVTTEVPVPTTHTPVSGPTDAYFYGLAHFWIGVLPETTRAMASVVLSDPSYGIDLADPIARAIEHLRSAVRLEPDEFWHRFMLGSVLSADDDPRAASIVLAECVAQRPDYPRALEARGLATLREGLAAKSDATLALARADFDRALALAPNDPWTHWGRARMFVELGQPAAATPHYDEALVTDPDGLALALPGAVTQGLSSGPSVAEARGALAALLVTDPSDAHAWATYAATCLIAGDEAEATRANDIAIGLHSPPVAQLVRGIIALRRGERAAALGALTTPAPNALWRRARALAEALPERP